MGIERLSISQAITAAQERTIRAQGEQSRVRSEPLHQSVSPNEFKVLRNGPAVPGEAEKIEKAATDFEALLLQQMLKTMWSSMTSSEGGVLASGQEQEFYRDILNEQVAKDIAEKQSLGIKQIVAADMWKQASRKGPADGGSGESGEL